MFISQLKENECLADSKMHLSARCILGVLYLESTLISCKPVLKQWLVSMHEWGMHLDYRYMTGTYHSVSDMSLSLVCQQWNSQNIPNVKAQHAWAHYDYTNFCAKCRSIYVVWGMLPQEIFRISQPPRSVLKPYCSAMYITCTANLCIWWVYDAILWIIHTYCTIWFQGLICDQQRYYQCQ